MAASSFTWAELRVTPKNPAARWTSALARRGVERVQQTLLEECWKPAFGRYLIPKYTGLQRDLVQKLRLYSSDRIHQGRRIKGLTPEQAITSRKLWLQSPQ